MTRDTLIPCDHDTDQEVFWAFDALRFEWLKSPSAVSLDPLPQAVREMLSRASVAAFPPLFSCHHSCGVMPMAFYCCRPQQCSCGGCQGKELSLVTPSFPS